MLAVAPRLSHFQVINQPRSAQTRRCQHYQRITRAGYLQIRLPPHSLLAGFNVSGFGAALIGSLIYSVLGIVIDSALQRLFPKQ